MNMNNFPLFGEIINISKRNHPKTTSMNNLLLFEKRQQIQNIYPSCRKLLPCIGCTLKKSKYRTFDLYPYRKLVLAVLFPPVQTGPRLAGKVPFPGNHIVWTLAGTCPRVPTKHVGFRGRKLTIGARNWYRAAVFIKCAHAWNVLARWPNAKPVRTAKPLNRDCPRQAGAIRWSCGRSVVKDKVPLQTVPGKRDFRPERGVWEMRANTAWGKLQTSLAIE